MRIYCDSVVLIYYLENTGAFHARAEPRLDALTAAGNTVVVSDLSRL